MLPWLVPWVFGPADLVPKLPYCHNPESTYPLIDAGLPVVMVCLPSSYCTPQALPRSLTPCPNFMLGSVSDPHPLPRTPPHQELHLTFWLSWSWPVRSDRALPVSVEYPYNPCRPLNSTPLLSIYGSLTPQDSCLGPPYLTAA